MIEAFFYFWDKGMTKKNVCNIQNISDIILMKTFPETLPKTIPKNFKT